MKICKNSRDIFFFSNISRQAQSSFMQAPTTQSGQANGGARLEMSSKKSDTHSNDVEAELEEVTVTLGEPSADEKVGFITGKSTAKEGPPQINRNAKNAALAVAFYL